MVYRMFAAIIFFICFLTQSHSSPIMGFSGENDVPCQCVPPNMCADDDASLTGQGLFDIRLDASDCPNYFDVCCENLVNGTHATRTQVTRNCGQQNPLGMGARITTSSENAMFGELPWSIVILIRDQETERNMYRCGGSLVHPQVVITAAHCVQDSNSEQLTIRAGEWNIKSREEPIPHQDNPAQEILIHPQYHSGSLRNDIALIFLEEPFELNDNVGVICLPSKELTIDDKNCIASGWGKEIIRKGRHSSIIKKVVIPMVPRKKCVPALRKTRLGSYYNLHRSFLCAGGEKNKDTCKGDGGSPLICPIEGHDRRFLQVGIVSWGIGCGETETPGIYVNIAMFVSWIDKELGARNFDTRVYHV